MNLSDRNEETIDAHSRRKFSKWTAEEFERLVFECKPKVAVFDCDGTLWGGDAGYGFMAWSLEQGLVSRSTNDWIDTRYRAYRAGDVSEEAMCGEMVQMYAGLREASCEAAAAQLRGRVCARARFCRDGRAGGTMRQAGIELWAVSSTNRWVIVEGLRDFGIPKERILAAEVRVKDGMITSEIIDVPTGRRQGDGAQARGLAGARCGFRQLGSRPGDAGDGAMPVSGESVAGAA